VKITLLGHASILVEMESATCLMDPVFYDPFEEGVVVSCPQRIVYPEKLPRVDILIVSHRHPDHFDIPSLAQVPRDCDVICPADPLIVYALKALKFARVHPVHPMGSIISSDFELYPTQSEVRSVQEFGMVFKEGTGTFWNQVDTSLSEQTIRIITERFGRVDLLVAMYACQNFEFFESRSTIFPFEDHRQNLENVFRIHPRLVSPGSAGFRFCGDHAWLNAFLFPISRERFVSDLHQLDPGIATQIMNPGDVFEMTADLVRFHPGASEIAVMTEDDTASVRFDPTASIPDLRDPNPDGYSEEHLTQVTARFVTEGMATFVREGYPKKEKIVSLYRQNRVHYSIAIVFPDSKVDWYRFDFGGEAVHLKIGMVAEKANLGHRIAASALVGWIERKKSFFYVRAYSRRFTTLYRLSKEGEKVHLEPKTLPDLLMHYLLNVSEGSEFSAKQHVDLQLQAFR